MTPEQVQQLIDQGLSQQSWWHMMLAILAGLVGFFGAYFGAYARQKGQNLATKEDIQSLTRIQEEVKSELLTRSHFSKTRYDREMEFYRSVWVELVNFYCESVSPARKKSPGEWDKMRLCLVKIIEDNKPFYPPEIRNKLKDFMEICERFVIFQSVDQPIRQDDRDDLGRLLQELKAQLEQVDGAIRDRLSKFDFSL